MNFLSSVQRVNQCLHEACSGSNVKYCNMFIDCGRGNNINLFNSKGESWQDWRNNGNASACFTTTGSFQYGVYQQAVLLTAERSIIRRYLYSLFWGFLVLISSLLVSLINCTFVEIKILPILIVERRICEFHFCSFKKFFWYQVQFSFSFLLILFVDSKLAQWLAIWPQVILKEKFCLSWQLSDWDCSYSHY